MKGTEHRQGVGPNSDAFQHWGLWKRQQSAGTTPTTLTASMVEGGGRGGRRSSWVMCFDSCNLRGFWRGGGFGFFFNLRFLITVIADQSMLRTPLPVCFERLF